MGSSMGRAGAGAGAWGRGAHGLRLGGGEGGLLGMSRHRGIRGGEGQSPFLFATHKPRITPTNPRSRTPRGPRQHLQVLVEVWRRTAEEVRRVHQQRGPDQRWTVARIKGCSQIGRTA